MSLHSTHQDGSGRLIARIRPSPLPPTDSPSSSRLFFDISPRQDLVPQAPRRRISDRPPSSPQEQHVRCLALSACIAEHALLIPFASSDLGTQSGNPLSFLPELTCRLLASDLGSPLRQVLAEPF